MTTDTQLNERAPATGTEVIASIDDKTPLQLWANGQAVHIFEQIEGFAKTLVFDCSTEKGKKECRSIDRKVAGAKNKLDKLAAAYIKELEADIVPIRKLRADLKAKFEVLQAEIKAPLTAIEEAEAKEAEKLKELQSEIAWIRSLGDPLKDGRELSVDELHNNKRILDKVFETLNAATWAELIGDAKSAYENAVLMLQNSLIAAETKAQQAATDPQAVDNGPRSAEQILDESPVTQRAEGEVATDELKAGFDEAEHQKAIRKQAYSALVKLGFNEQLAKNFIGAVHKRLVPNVAMTYQS